MQPILIGSASEKETLRSNFPEDLECLMTATSDEELVDFFVVDVVRRLGKNNKISVVEFYYLKLTQRLKNCVRFKSVRASMATTVTDKPILLLALQ